MQASDVGESLATGSVASGGRTSPLGRHAGRDLRDVGREEE